MRRPFSTSRRDGELAVTSLVETPLPPSPQTARRRVLIRVGTSALIVAVVAGFLAVVATNRLQCVLNCGTTAAPKHGGSIADGIQFDADTLLPLRTSLNWSLMIDQAIWAPLWYGDPQGAFHAGIAKEVPSAANGDISPDLTTWTIHLRPGLKWSDGSPLTAADCAFSFNLYADPDYIFVGGGPTGFPTTDPADPIGFVSATVVGTDTVVLKLKHPYVAMTTLLADGSSACLPRAVFAGMTAAEVVQSTQNFWPNVTSGPFKIKEHVGGDHVTVVRNPDYYQGPGMPYLDQITFKVFNATDPSTALQAHTVDTAWYLDDTELASYQSIPGYTVYLDRHPVGYELLVFNMSDPLISDYAIRQAFTMGFDTTEVLPILNGTAKLTCDDATGTFAHEESLIPCYHYDPTAASQLLEDDGWRMGADGVRHKNGQPLELAFATTGRSWRQETAKLIKRELASIGMKLDVTTYAVADYFGAGNEKVLSGGHFQVAEFASAPSYDPDDHYFLSSDQIPEQGGNNVMHYANPEVDAEERIQQSTADLNARKAAFHIIHADVLRDVPVMYLYSGQNIACARSDLHNYDPSAFPVSETWNVWEWWLG